MKYLGCIQTKSAQKWWYECLGTFTYPVRKVWIASFVNCILFSLNIIAFQQLQFKLGFWITVGWAKLSTFITAF